MAEKNKSRKSTRKFGLEKPVERHFDLEKEDDIDVSSTIGQKDKGNNQSSLESAPINPVPLPNTDATNNSGKGKKWAAAAAIAGLLAIGGGTYYYTQKDTPPVNLEQTTQTLPEGNEESNETENEVSSTTDVNESVPGNETTPAQSGGSSERPEQKENVGAPADTQSAGNKDASEKGMNDAGTADVVSANETSGTQTQSETPKAADEGMSKNQPAKPAQDAGNQPRVTQTPQSHAQPASPSGSNVSPKKPGTSPVPTYQSQPVTGSVEQLAADVVFGKYGNNPDRRRLLGDRYEEIQRKVNEMYRTGKFF